MASSHGVMALWGFEPTAVRGKWFEVSNSNNSTMVYIKCMRNFPVCIASAPFTPFYWHQVTLGEPPTSYKLWAIISKYSFSLLTRTWTSSRSLNSWSKCSIHGPTAYNDNGWKSLVITKYLNTIWSDNLNRFGFIWTPHTSLTLKSAKLHL